MNDIFHTLNKLSTLVDLAAQIQAQIARVEAQRDAAQRDGRTGHTEAEWGEITGAEEDARAALAKALGATPSA